MNWVLLEDEGTYASGERLEDLLVGKDPLWRLRAVGSSAAPRTVRQVRKPLVVRAQRVRNDATSAKDKSLDDGDEVGVASFIWHASSVSRQGTCWGHRAGVMGAPRAVCVAARRGRVNDGSLDRDAETVHRPRYATEWLTCLDVSATMPADPPHERPWSGHERAFATAARDGGWRNRRRSDQTLRRRSVKSIEAVAGRVRDWALVDVSAGRAERRLQSRGISSPALTWGHFVRFLAGSAARPAEHRPGEWLDDPSWSQVFLALGAF